MACGSCTGKRGARCWIALYTGRVFAALAAVIPIGPLVEAVVFNALERVTVRRWGLQRREPYIRVLNASGNGGSE
jgi:NitT/TauT family transport system permease protein